MRGEPTQRRERASLAEAERGYLERLLDETGWNRARAAEILGIDRYALPRELERYGIGGPE